MTYDSPSDKLDTKEICEYLNMTTKMGLADLIAFVWKQGYEWGYERGLEDAE